jgi:SAM-dependent methyltransferase
MLESFKFPESNIVDLDIFLLIGQSNISGRGKLSDFINEYDKVPNKTSYSSTIESDNIPPQDIGFDQSIYMDKDGTFKKPFADRIFRFDTTTGWNNSFHPFELHKNVDTLKSVGLGPAIPFACHYINHYSKSNNAIGLVPAAVGGTSLSEWELNEYTDNPKKLIEDFYNLPINSEKLLFNSLKSFYFSMLKVPESMKINFKGILWYQGENDSALSEEEAYSYPSRFNFFLSNLNSYLYEIITDIRRTKNVNICTTTNSDSVFCKVLQIIPFISVAITTTRSNQCKFRDIIRQQQLERKFKLTYFRSSFVIVEDVIDAFGLPLQSDNIHIGIFSIFELGKHFYSKYFGLLQYFEKIDHFGESCEKTPEILNTFESVQISLDPLKSDSVNHFQFDKYLLMPCYTMLGKATIDSYHLFDQIKSQVMRDINEEDTNASVLLEQTRSKSFSSFTRSKSSSPYPILRSGLKAINFTYGELNYLDFCKILHMLNIKAGSCFVDLGCGSGVLLAAACLSGIPLGKVCGIELSGSKIAECKLLMNHVKEHSNIDVEVIEGNFLITPWKDFDVVYTCSTCFAPDQMDKLIYLCKYLKAGANVIFVDKEPFESSKNDHSDDRDSDGIAEMFKLIASSQCFTSWGTADVFVYEKLF